MATDEYAIILLAAGGSFRMGRPKQLLPYGEKALVRHIAEEAVATGLTPVIAVTGGYGNAVEKELQGTQVQCIRNYEWHEGMGTSIKTGVIAISKMPRTDIAGVILAVCDQPYVGKQLLLDLVTERKRSGKGIVACAYADTVGTPVLFDRKYFTALKALEVQEGAKVLVNRFAEDMTVWPFPQGSLDIDTPDDYQQLMTYTNNNDNRFL